MTNICVAAFYHFVKLDDYKNIQNRLLNKCLSEDIMGTILLAKEGINGTVAGTDESIINILNYFSFVFITLTQSFFQKIV